jgi:hypothetical protein
VTVASTAPPRLASGREQAERATASSPITSTRRARGRYVQLHAGPLAHSFSSSRRAAPAGAHVGHQMPACLPRR